MITNMYQCDKLRVGNHIQTKEWDTFNLSEVQFRVKVTSHLIFHETFPCK